MTWRNRLLSVAAFICAFGLPHLALAQASNAVVVASCGTPPTTYVAGQNRQVTQDTGGKLCNAATITPAGTQNTNTSQIGANTVLTGNGVTGTGSQRVTIASDNTAFAVTPTPTTAGGLTTGRVVTGTSGTVKASAGQLFTLVWQNTNAAIRYIQIYNKASAPTLSTDTPILTVPMAASSVGNLTITDLGAAFSTGIAWAVTTDDIAIPTTAGTSGDLHATFGYK